MELIPWNANKQCLNVSLASGRENSKTIKSFTKSFSNKENIPERPCQPRRETTGNSASNNIGPNASQSTATGPYFSSTEKHDLQTEGDPFSGGVERPPVVDKQHPQNPPTQHYIYILSIPFQAITAVEKSGDEIVGEIILWNKQNTLCGSNDYDVSFYLFTFPNVDYAIEIIPNRDKISGNISNIFSKLIAKYSLLNKYMLCWYFGSFTDPCSHHKFS